MAQISVLVWNREILRNFFRWRKFAFFYDFWCVFSERNTKVIFDRIFTIFWSVRNYFYCWASWILWIQAPDFGSALFVRNRRESRGQDRPGLSPALKSRIWPRLCGSGSRTFGPGQPYSRSFGILPNFRNFSGNFGNSSEFPAVVVEVDLGRLGLSALLRDANTQSARCSSRMPSLRALRALRSAWSSASRCCWLLSTFLPALRAGKRASCAKGEG